MPKIPCPSGRKRPDGRPVWHKASGTIDDCPICFKDKPIEQTPATETAKAGTEAPPAPEPKPAAPAKTAKPGMMARLGFGSRTTSPEIALAPPKNPEPTYFVQAPYVEKFANLIYGGIRWGFNIFDRFAMTEEAGLKRFTEAHPELLHLSEFEKEAIKLDPATDIWGKFATGFTRLIGCKTQEQAHAAIGTLDMIGHFGALLGFGVEHVWTSWQKGKPFREAKKQAKKAAIAAHQKEVADARRDRSEGKGGVVPEAGRAGAPAAA